MAQVVMARIAVFQDASDLAKIPTFKPERCHQLAGDRDEQFAVDLVQPFRMAFEVAHDAMPRDKFGGIDKERVTAIRIVEVTDYHR